MVRVLSGALMLQPAMALLCTSNTVTSSRTPLIDSLPAMDPERVPVIGANERAHIEQNRHRSDRHCEIANDSLSPVQWTARLLNDQSQMTTHETRFNP